MNITQGLLKMMGSRLEVESVYGEGSDFHFTVRQKVVSREPMGDFSSTYRRQCKNSLPLYKESFTAPTAQILAVDDTEMNLKVLAGLLKPTKIKNRHGGERLRHAQHDKE